MNQDSNHPKLSGIFRFISRNWALIVALIILIIVIKVAWSSQINHRGDAFWDGVRFVFFVASGVIFTILMTVHLAIVKTPLKFVLVLLSLFLSAIFFYFCIQITNFLGYNYNNFLIQTKQNKIEQNIEKIITLEHFPSTSRELFNASDFFIKAEKEKQSQYYYLNNSGKLVEMKSLQNKNIIAYGQASILSPSKEKIALLIDDRLQIFSQNQNDSWTISIDQTYDYLSFDDFFFNKDEKLIFSVTDYKLGDFSMIGAIDFDSDTIQFSRSEEKMNNLYPENQNNSCENIAEIDVHSYSTRSYQSLPNNNCLYVTSSYNQQERRYIYTLKLYNALSMSTKSLLENDYTYFDLINILYIPI